MIKINVPEHLQTASAFMTLNLTKCDAFILGITGSFLCN